MKVLIIGASGFLGRHLFSHLKTLGHQVVGTQTSPPPDPRGSMVQYNLISDKITGKVDRSFLVNPPDHPLRVVICSAISQIDRCFTDRETTYKINVTGIRGLIQDLEELKAKILFVSSSSVFDGETGCYHEASKVNPITVYGQHKEGNRRLPFIPQLPVHHF